ncbi:MAG: hypothetical protein ACRDJH_15915 [Thermomicrobiales bacterium]
MAKNIRYYITCDDDRPVVHTIPVSVRTDEASPDVQARVDTDTSPRNEPQVPARVAKLVRSAVRRAPADR